MFPNTQTEPDESDVERNAAEKIRLLRVANIVNAKRSGLPRICDAFLAHGIYFETRSNLHMRFSQIRIACVVRATNGGQFGDGSGAALQGVQRFGRARNTKLCCYSNGRTVYSVAATQSCRALACRLGSASKDGLKFVTDAVTSRPAARPIAMCARYPCAAALKAAQLRKDSLREDPHDLATGRRSAIS